MVSIFRVVCYCLRCDCAGVGGDPHRPGQHAQWGHREPRPPSPHQGQNHTQEPYWTAPVHLVGMCVHACVRVCARPGVCMQAISGSVCVGVGVCGGLNVVHVFVCPSFCDKL